jgi:Uma2 family endonuclease
MDNFHLDHQTNCGILRRVYLIGGKETCMLTAIKPFTLHEFEDFLIQPENRDRLFELINGEIVEKMPTQEHGLIASNINAPLALHVKAHKAGRVGIEVRYKYAGDARNSRMPDVSFTSNRQPLVREGAVPFLPDLAIEIKSPDDTMKEMREKAEYYLANGVKIVWIVYPQHRMVEVYSEDEDIKVLFGHDVLTGGEVLPGFRLPVQEVFADST